ncbi:PDZ domain-containing protein [Candidatus Saccharibacteria bacterium]|nr:MAG: PDZ domain-containing protein [Candidatus Saccharibacteria bacterium]
MADTNDNLKPASEAPSAPTRPVAATPKKAPVTKKVSFEVPVPTMPAGPSPATRSKLLNGALALLVVFGVGFGGGWLGAASHNDDGSTSVSTQKTVLTSQGNLISSIAKDVGPSVVSVDVTTQTAGSQNPFYNLYGGGSGSQTQQGAGTGMILSSDGLILTNRHVVPSGTTSVSVTLSDGTVYKDVKVIGRTNDSDSLDVAFLKIQDLKGKTLTPIKVGDSSKVAVGESVIAIGNALGQFQNTVTSGIISGYGRSVTAGDENGSSTENLDNLFQTDAAINPGNSGGPLVNLNGEVIGMNTAVAGEGAQNIGFAIPINDITGLITSVKDTGKLQRPYLGVVYVPLTDDLAKQYNLSVTRGAYIPSSSDLGQTTIIDGGPAQKAGLQEGDVITKVDGTEINETTSLTSLLGKHKVGDTVTLTIVRDGKTITKDVTLGAAPTSN